MKAITRSLLFVVVLNSLFYALGLHFSADIEKTTFAVTLSVIFNLISVWLSPGKDILSALRLVPRSALLLAAGLVVFLALIPIKSRTASVLEVITLTSFFLLGVVALSKRGSDKL